MNSQNTGVCRLCLKEGELCNSHIFPEFFYKEIYNEKHEILRIPANHQDKVESPQKGIREHLLCKNCETQLSKYEKYAKGIFYGVWNGLRYPVPKTTENNEYFAVVEDVDYKSLKLLQMSLLWRAGVSSLKEFGAVRLGHHEENLRRMIHQEDPGEPSQYGCVLYRLSDQQGDLFDAVSSPEKLELQGHTCFRYMLGGFIWLHFVSSHRPPNDFIEAFLQNKNGGQLVIRHKLMDDVPFLRHQALQLARRKDDVAEWVNRKKSKK